MPFDRTRQGVEEDVTGVGILGVLNKFLDNGEPILLPVTHVLPYQVELGCWARLQIRHPAPPLDPPDRFQIERQVGE